MDISNYNIEQCDAVSVLNAIMDMHDHPQKIDQIVAAISPIAAAAAAYSEGKPQLAQAITAKGVTTAADASLATMAQNVRAIVKSTTILQGGEMYAKQLFGALEAPCFWNLYDVLVNIMSYNTNSFSGSPYSALQGHKFGGIMLFEFPKGDATTSLSDFPLTGGGYIMSDGAAYYNEAPTHTWNDDLDGKGNRWIALLMATEGENFTIASAAVCPSSIYIGGKVGVITYGGSAAGNISEIVVPDGNTLDGFIAGEQQQDWGTVVTVRNLNSTGYLIFDALNARKVYAKLNDNFSGDLFVAKTMTTYNLQCIIVEGKKFSSGAILKCVNTGNGNTLQYLSDVVIKGIDDGTLYIHKLNGVTARFPSLNRVLIFDAEGGTIGFHNYNANYAPANLTYVYIGFATNDRSKSITLSDNCWKNVTDLEIKNGWCKPLNISVCGNLTEENMVAHILNRLGTNTGSAITITLGSTNLGRLTADEKAIATNKGFTLA